MLSDDGQVTLNCGRLVLLRALRDGRWRDLDFAVVRLLSAPIMSSIRTFHGIEVSRC